ncbi:MAG: DUF3943 domain-containing protein [Prevotella sp.]|nr:DUF3943 domain-containing protein [Prevotella sp.]
MREKPSLTLAVGNLLLANGTIHLIGRLGADDDCSDVSMHSIKRNLKSGLAWDNNKFFVNQLGHSYIGGLSFNAARSSGFSFVQSVPFSAIGSLIWEYFGETEQPSINDMITTTIAGTMFGEGSYRLAKHVLDDSDTGGRRIAREATAMFLNPFQGLQRLLDGSMWKVRRNASSHRDEEMPMDSKNSLTLSDRYVVASDGESHGCHHPIVAISTEYGETADGEGHTCPYDFLALDAAMALGGGQPVIPRFNVMARICSTPMFMNGMASGELGLYQYFTYEDTRLGDSIRGPFPFGESASLGPGLVVKCRQLSSRLALEQRLFARGVILGSAESDYYHCRERQYNMGSGFGASSMTRVEWDDLLRLQFDAYYLHLYTWRGYEPDEVRGMESGNLNVLGDRSHARLLKLDMQLQARLSRHLDVALGAAWFSRNTHYKYYPKSHKSSYEFRTGLSWNF